MDAPLRRSTDVTSTLTLPLTAARSRQDLDFDALYRAARDDVFAYVATLLGDRSTAEDVTASAFERAYRRQRTDRSARGSERAWLLDNAELAAVLGVSVSNAGTMLHRAVTKLRKAIDEHA